MPQVRRRTSAVIVGVTAALFAVFVFGGYALGWTWTGLSRAVTLWDWLQVLALPLALGTAPVLLRHRRGLTRRHRIVLASVLLGFAVLVLLSYALPLAWTGFPGNTLWDWLELVLLPLVVAVSSLWVGLGHPRRRHLTVGVVVAVGFCMLAVAGYLVPLNWTGFSGNTMWDWIKLLLVPLLVPIVLVPLAAGRVRQHLDTQPS